MFGIELEFGSFTYTVLIGIFTILLLYWYGTRNHDYWKKRGVRYVKPLPFVGSVLDMFKGPMHKNDQNRYKEYGSLYGFYEGNSPVLVVADPTHIRNILVKDFQAFKNRRQGMGKTGDVILDNVLNGATGETWKRMRTVITPTFSVSKLKRMMTIFQDCCVILRQNLRNAAKDGPVDVKRFYGTFTMDTIASSAFSIKIDSHNDPDNTFVKLARSFFSVGFSFRFFFFILAPRLLMALGLSPFPTSRTTFFQDTTIQIIEERKKSGQTRNDFLQLLLDVAKEVGDEEEAETEKEDIATNYADLDAAQQIAKLVSKRHITMNEIVSNSVNFLLAGYVTTISALSFATYMLALNPDKLREEVDAALKESDGQLTYDAIQSMKYLDNVISETLRYFPPAARLDRITDSNYKLGETGITLEKGTVVYVPVFAMHHDPKLFPDPEKFDPNRFTAEERAKRNPYAYLPFGGGPRNCVGMRFALLEMKTGLADVVANFIIKPCPKSKDFELEKFLGQVGLMQPKEMFVNLEYRKDH